LAEWPGQKGPVFIKIYKRGGLLGRLVQDLYFGKSRFHNEFNVLKTLGRLGFGVPEPLGVVTRRVFGPLYKGALFTRYAQGFVPLPQAYASIQEGPILQALANALVRLHDAGIEHKDLNLNNFLVRTETEKSVVSLIVVDFDKAKARKRPISSLKRAYGLIRMERSANKILGKEFSLPFFTKLSQAYLNELPQKRRLLWSIRTLRPALKVRYALSDLLHV
jgi:tRNA A-37 threonylcarbamoyl transferase component Bud32